MNPSINTPPTPAPDTRQEQIHHLWLTLVEISARGDGRFEPSPQEQADIDLLALRTGLTLGAVEHLTDRARRFVQIQTELTNLVDSEQGFKQAGVELQKVMTERQAVLREWGQKLRLLERNRCALGQAVMRLTALRQESETLQWQVAKYETEAINGE